MTATATAITREREGLFTVEVHGTYSWPEANVAACTLVAWHLDLAAVYSVSSSRAWMLVKNVRQAQHQSPTEGFLPAWTVSVRAERPDRVTLAAAR